MRIIVSHDGYAGSRLYHSPGLPDLLVPTSDEAAIILDPNAPLASLEEGRVDEARALLRRALSPMADMPDRLTLDAPGPRF